MVHNHGRSHTVTTLNTSVFQVV